MVGAGDCARYPIILKMIRQGPTEFAVGAGKGLLVGDGGYIYFFFSRQSILYLLLLSGKRPDIY